MRMTAMRFGMAATFARREGHFGGWGVDAFDSFQLSGR